MGGCSVGCTRKGDGHGPWRGGARPLSLPVLCRDSAWPHMPHVRGPRPGRRVHVTRPRLGLRVPSWGPVAGPGRLSPFGAILCAEQAKADSKRGRLGQAAPALWIPHRLASPCPSSPPPAGVNPLVPQVQLARGSGLEAQAVRSFPWGPGWAGHVGGWTLSVGWSRQAGAGLPLAWPSEAWAPEPAGSSVYPSYPSTCWAA